MPAPRRGAHHENQRVAVWALKVAGRLKSRSVGRGELGGQGGAPNSPPAVMVTLLERGGFSNAPGHSPAVRGWAAVDLSVCSRREAGNIWRCDVFPHRC